MLTVLSGTLAAATVAGTGVATAAAAQETARANAVKAREKAAADAAAATAHHEALAKWAKDNPVVVTKARPTKTVIGPATLVKASSSGSSRVGGGSSSCSARPPAGLVDAHEEVDEPAGTPAAAPAPGEHRLVTTLAHEPATPATRRRRAGRLGVARPRDLRRAAHHAGCRRGRHRPGRAGAARGRRACSRFRDDSDLVRANHAAGHAVEVSPVLVGAVRVALEAADETDGLVDPLLGGLLSAAGYDRTFSLVPADDPTPAALPVRGGTWEEVLVTDTTVPCPGAVALDLGATGKAFAADLVALCVADALGVPVLVGVGGDLRVASPDDTGAATRWCWATAAPTSRPVARAPWCGCATAAWPPRASRPGAGVAAAASGTTSSTRAPACRRRARGAPSPRLGRTAAAANAATTASVVLGEAAYGGSSTTGSRPGSSTTRAT